MSVVVFGGAGFIGSNLVDELMTMRGLDVTVFDNLSAGKKENIARWMKNENFTFINGDIRDRELVRRACDHKDWVFHLAAMSRIQPSITDPHLAFDENVMGTVNVLEGCRLGGVKRFVYSASSSVTGDNGLEYINAGKPTPEECEPDYKSAYALTKHFGELAAELYRKLYGLSTISLRYFNVYGPRHLDSGDYSTVVAIFRRQFKNNEPITVVGDGEQRRDFTFVGDVVRANMLAVMNRDVSGTVNIGTGKNYSINEIASLVAPGHPVVNLPERKGEYKATLADVTRANNELGWKPTVCLADGLKVLDMFERKVTRSNIILAR